jgi:hypothetical protein
MLGKLLKYEIKATARLFLPFYLTILIFSAINLFLLGTPTNIGERTFSFSSLATTISMIVYVTLMVGMVLMTLVVMIQRFYRNLLGDEGYLMFTLPVKSWSHILSKLAVSTLWTVLSGFVALCSIFIISSNNISALELFKRLSIALSQFIQYFKGSALLVSFEAIILGLLILASTILTIYAAIALGHLFNKYKLLISFGMYIVLKTIPQIFIMLFTVIFSNSTALEKVINSLPSTSQVNAFLLLSILYFGAITAGYFVLTNYILKRKLNLE